MHPHHQTRGPSSNKQHHHGASRVISLLLLQIMEVAQVNPGRNQRKSPINGVSLPSLPSKGNKVAGLRASNNHLLQPLQVAMLHGSNQDRDSKALAPPRLKVPIVTGQCYAALAALKALVSCASKRAKSLGVCMRYAKNLSASGVAGKVISFSKTWQSQDSMLPLSASEITIMHLETRVARMAPKSMGSQ